MFQPRFAELVESGQKTQTVRPWPKRMPKSGDRISCRAWTGKPYRSKQRVLCEAIISAVNVVEIDHRSLIIDSQPVEKVRGRLQFALRDGFACYAELCDWFESTHGLPFHGIVIRWTNAPGERPSRNHETQERQK